MEYIERGRDPPRELPRERDNLDFLRTIKKEVYNLKRIPRVSSRFKQGPHVLRTFIVLIVALFIIGSSYLFITDTFNLNITGQTTFSDQAQTYQDKINLDVESSQEYAWTPENYGQLTGLGESRKVDVSMEYNLVDSFSRTLSTDKETIAVDTQASFVKEIIVPKDAVPGNYFIYVKATYAGQSASSSAGFVVRQRSFFQTDTFIYILLIAILLVLAVVFLMIYLSMKTKSRAKREETIDEHVLASKDIIKPRKKQQWVLKR